MGSNTQVKKLLENIGLDKQENPDFDNKLNTSIQNKFDSVFKEGEATEEELSFSANNEKTNSNLKVVAAPEDAPVEEASADFNLEDDAPLTLGENSSPVLSMPETTNSNISFEATSGGLDIGGAEDNAPASEEADLSFGEISEETEAAPVKEVSSPVLPIPTKTRLQAVPETPENEEEVETPEASSVMPDLAATEDETGEIEVPNFSEAGPQQVASPRSPAVSAPQTEKVHYDFDQNEVARLQAMVRELRADRNDLLKQIHEAQKELKVQLQSNLTFRAEVEDGKLERNVMKKRHAEEMEEIKHQARMSEHKKQEYEEKVKNYQKEFERLGQKVQFEVSHVKKREKELETKLELLIMDSQAQIQSRDNKTLELKRKIDALEFNMENLAIQEAKAREDKLILEDKLTKIMKNLRGSIKVIESDLSHELSGLVKNDSDKNNS